MQQKVNEIHQNSIQHTELLNNIVHLISGTQLSTQWLQQQVRPPGQPSQEADSLREISREDISELKNASSSPINFSVKLENRLFMEDEFCNRNVHGGH